MPDPAVAHERAATRHAAEYAPDAGPRLLTFWARTLANVHPRLSGDAANRPLSVVMAALARNVDVSWGLLNAGVVLAVVPTVALAAVVWRFVVEGLHEGGIVN
jgi:ABC-type glycerol-3-phosphate transport system permease component